MAAAGQIKAGSAFVEFFLEEGKLQRGLKKTEMRLRHFGSRLRNNGAAFLKGGLFGLTAIAFPFAKLAEFDDKIREVGAVSKATTSQLKMLESTAKELGRTTSFTAVEVGSLMAELGRAGFLPTQINAMTAAVLDLSRATKTEAAQAAGIMAATIRQFGLEATDATRVANIFTVAANSTFNTVEGLGDALSYAGPVAADLGMSLEDTVAILGTLGNVGIQGSAAGTAIRRLATLSAAEAKKMQGVFGVAFADAAGNARPLVDVLDDVATATNGLPTAERVSKFNEAFGLLGITGASTISKSAAATKELAESLKNVSTEAADAAAAMDAGPGGMIRRLQSAFEGAQLAIGSAVERIVSSVGEDLTAALGKFTEFINKNQYLVQTFLKVSAVAAVVGTALITVGGTFQAVAFAVGGVSTAVAFATTSLAFMKAALLATSTALTTTIIPNIIAYTSVVGAARIATAALKGGMIALAAYGIYKVATAVYNASGGIKSFNSELKIMQGLADQSATRLDRMQQSTLKSASRLEGDNKAQYLATQLEMAQKELSGSKAQLKGQQRTVDNLSTAYNVATGNKILASEEAVLAEKEKRVASQTAFVQQLEDALNDAQYESKAAAKEKAAAERNGRTLPTLPDTADGLAAVNAELAAFSLDAAGNASVDAAAVGIGFGAFGGLAGIAANAGKAAAQADAIEAGGNATMDPATVKLVAEAGMGFGFGAMGGLAGIAGAAVTNAPLQDTIAEMSNNLETGSAEVAASNAGIEVRTAEGQDVLAKALFGATTDAEQTVSAIEAQTAALKAEEEKSRREAAKAPRLQAAKT